MIGKDATAEIDAGPLWKTLHAVRAGHAHSVDDAVWFQNAGPLATQLIMKQLATRLPG